MVVRRSAVLALISAALLPGSVRAAHAQSVQLRVDSSEIYVDVPFTLKVIVDGFEESPAPVIEDFEIEGCRVTSIGVAPQISTSMSIDINGRRTRSR